MDLQIPCELPADRELAWAQNALKSELVNKLGENSVAYSALAAVVAAGGHVVSFLAAVEAERINGGVWVSGSSGEQATINTFLLLCEEGQCTAAPTRHIFSITYSAETFPARDSSVKPGWLAADANDGFCHSRHRHFADAFAWCVENTGLRQ